MKKKLQPNSFWDNVDFPVAVAHRGGDVAGIDKENSLKAFQSAYDLGYRWFETDVVPTKDNVLLAIHGRGMQRKPNKDLPSRLKIQSMTYQRIKKQLRVGGENPLKLADLMDKFPDTRIFIDPKTFKSAPVLADFLISRPNDLHRVCIGSFHGRNTQLIGRRVKLATGVEITCAAIGKFRGSLLLLSAQSTVFRPFLLAQLKRSNIRTFYLPKQWLIGKRGQKIIKFSRENHINIAVYTPNDQESIKALITAGVEVIMSDNIRLLKKYIKP